MQSLLYLYLVPSGCVKRSEKLPRVKPLYRTINQHLIFTATCPNGSNMRNPEINGSTASGIKWSRPQDVLPSLRFTTHPSFNIPLYQLKSLVPPKNAHSQIPSHWTFFITLSCGMRILYRQQTKIHIGATHTIKSSSSYVRLLEWMLIKYINNYKFRNYFAQY